MQLLMVKSVTVNCASFNGGSHTLPPLEEGFGLGGTPPLAASFSPNICSCLKYNTHTQYFHNHSYGISTNAETNTCKDL